MKRATLERESFPPEFTATDRFEIVTLVGRGAAGLVYEAFDRERNTRVALKTLHQPSAETILLLKNEFRGVHDLRHPNLVTLHELFEHQGRWFYTMDFVEGGDFLSYVRDLPWRAPGANAQPARPGTLQEGRLRAALGQLAHGLCALHEANKVHRDIKPSNVLVNDAGHVVILDFGILSTLEGVEQADEALVGTAHYMAPEQAVGEVSAPSADWYAFGVLLYQALTGQLPFVGPVHEIIERKMVETPVSPGRLAPGVPADLEALCMELLRADPAARPSGAEVLARLSWTAGVQPAVVTTQTSVFVGRSGELAALERAFADVRMGDNVTVLVHGESGVGKSFLVRQFTDQIRRDPRVRIYRSRCYERESVAYKAVDGIIDGLCVFLRSLPDADVRPLLPPHAALLCRVFPVLEQVEPLVAMRSPDDEVQSPKELRARVFAALRELLTRVATRWPTVFVVDDLQWADADSWVLLAQLTRLPDPPPLLFIGTQRIGTETRARVREGELGEARLEGDVRNIVLEPLPTEDAQKLASQLLSQSDPDNDGMAAAIAAEAKGHPLFIDELTRRRTRRDDSLKPIKLDDAVWQRVALLDPTARKVLELVAVAASPIERAITAEAAAMTLGHLAAAEAVLRAGNFVRTTGIQRDDTIETYHDRVGESVRARLGAAERSAWHGRIATALEQSKSADPETLCMHWRGAGNRARAAEYALVAADKASAALAFDHAVRLYRTALELGELPADQARDLNLRVAGALASAGRGAEAATVYLELAGDDHSLKTFDLRRRAAEEYMCSGHLAEGETVLREVLASIDVSYPKSTGAALGSVLYNRMVLQLRGLSFERKEEAACAEGSLRRVDALCSAASAFAMIDPFVAASFHARHMLAALRLGEPFRVSRALSMYTINVAVGGTTKREQAQKQRAMNRELMAQQPAHPFLEGMAHGMDGFCEYFLGEWDKAKEELVRAEKVLREQCLGASYELRVVQMLLCRTEVFQGDFASLARRAPEYLREAEDKSDHYASVALLASAGYLLQLAAGDVEAAERAVGRAEERLSADKFQLPHFYCQAARMQLELYRGDAAAAHARWLETFPKAKKNKLFFVQSTHILTLEHRARAALALATARAGVDASLLAQVEADVRALEGFAVPWASALATLLQAGVALAREDREAGAARLGAAVKALEATGMRLYAAAALLRLGQLTGGAAGQGQVTHAATFMQRQGIREPERMAAMLAPAGPR
jgi:tetratricopeptide (TPR) repeat protein